MHGAAPCHAGYACWLSSASTELGQYSGRKGPDHHGDVPMLPLWERQNKNPLAYSKGDNK